MLKTKQIQEWRYDSHMIRYMGRMVECSLHDRDCKAPCDPPETNDTRYCMYCLTEKICVTGQLTYRGNITKSARSSTVFAGIKTVKSRIIIGALARNAIADLMRAPRKMTHLFTKKRNIIQSRTLMRNRP